MKKQSLSRLDRNATASMQGRPDWWFWPVMIAITTVGSPVLLAPLAFLVGAQQLQSGDAKIGITLWLACLSSLIVGGLFKFGPRRARPDTAYARDMFFKTYSFPSGHAFSSAVFYGLAACFAYIYLPVAEASLIAVVLLGLAMAVGFSRIYLGAHYVLDVLGGWLFAGAVLIALVTFLAS